MYSFNHKLNVKNPTIVLKDSPTATSIKDRLRNHYPPAPRVEPKAFEEFETARDQDNKLLDVLQNIYQGFCDKNRIPPESRWLRLAEMRLGGHLEDINKRVNSDGPGSGSGSRCFLVWEPPGHYMLLLGIDDNVAANKMGGHRLWLLFDSFGRTREGDPSLSQIEAMRRDKRGMAGPAILSGGRVFNVNQGRCIQDPRAQTCGAWVVYNFLTHALPLLNDARMRLEIKPRNVLHYTGLQDGGKTVGAGIRPVIYNGLQSQLEDWVENVYHNIEAHGGNDSAPVDERDGTSEIKPIMQTLGNNEKALFLSLNKQIELIPSREEIEQAERTLHLL